MDESDISEKESILRSTSPFVRGIRVCEATSKEGLTPDNLSINSQPFLVIFQNGAISEIVQQDL